MRFRFVADFTFETDETDEDGQLALVAEHLLLISRGREDGLMGIAGNFNITKVNEDA